jgi:CHAD domain-containing protein
LRRNAYDEIQEAIQSPRYTTSVIRLLGWFESAGRRRDSASDEADPVACPIGRVAPGLLERRRRKTRRRSKGFGRLTPPERHKLRIAVKKLRYTIELSGSLFDNDDLEKYVGSLKRLQSDLGYANDIRVAHEFLIELFAQTDPRSPAGRAWVALLEAHDQVLAGEERKLRKHLRQLNKAAPFWHN